MWTYRILFVFQAPAYFEMKFRKMKRFFVDKWNTLSFWAAERIFLKSHWKLELLNLHTKFCVFLLLSMVAKQFPFKLDWKLHSHKNENIDQDPIFLAEFWKVVNMETGKKSWSVSVLNTIKVRNLKEPLKISFVKCFLSGFIKVIF